MPDSADEITEGVEIKDNGLQVDLSQIPRRGRGRPKGAKNKPKAAPPVASTPQESPPQPEPPLASVSPPAPAPAPKPEEKPTPTPETPTAPVVRGRRF